MTKESKEEKLRAHLQTLSKENLVERILQLEKHSTQLRNQLKKANGVDQESESESAKKNSRPFDFQKVTKRHILLRFYYLGWDYQGFALQEDVIQTIEYHLFEALKRTCLIESRETSNYHRCGRTDKGVSAFSQVVSIDVRSKLTNEEILNHQNLDKELTYCSMLNRVLPADIKCVAWMPVNNPLYSARFDCQQRTYRYVFPKSDLSLERMNEAASHMIGTHDFRNLCKMDVDNGVTAFIRNIQSIKIQPVTNHISDNGYDLYYFEIKSSAFLWHQIRCIVAVLFLVGLKLEKPDVVRELLDVERNPCKPNYRMASHVPLNLYNCEYRETGASQMDDTEPKVRDLTEWIYDEFNLRTVIGTLQGQWCVEAVKTSMVKMMLNDLEDLYAKRFPDQSPIIEQVQILQDEKKTKNYKPLMSRQTCQSLEVRIENVEAKKRRMEAVKFKDNK